MADGRDRRTEYAITGPRLYCPNGVNFLKPKRLFLLRHAKSSWANAFVDDFARDLNKRGRKAAEALAKWLKPRDFTPDLVLCSAALRTRQTLALVQDGFASAPELSIERRLYLAEAEAMLARFQENMETDKVEGTPTLFINGEPHSNMSYEDLKVILDEKLAG